jgi:hypothetical protein
LDKDNFSPEKKIKNKNLTRITYQLYDYDQEKGGNNVIVCPQYKAIVVLWIV